jgi:diacylglycerol kinase family enzyme
LATNSNQVAILVNPTAGTGPAQNLVDELITSLRVRGLAPVVCLQREQLSSVLESQRQDVRCVVAAGGDGTLAEVLNRAPGMPVALLPLGNENLMAQQFAVERSGSKLAEIIAAGQVRRLDLARVHGRLFSLMASAGFDAEVVHRVHRQRHSHINRLHYLHAIGEALQTYSFPPIEVEIVDSGERLRGAYVFVFNMPRYGMGLPIAPEARADDGLLNLYVFQRSQVGDLIRYVAAIVMRRHEQLPDTRRRLVRQVRLWSTKPVPLQIDGDPAGGLPAAIEVAPQALQLLVPGNHAPAR